MNRSASQSSSSGCVGSLPWLPKSSCVAHDAAAEVHAPDAIDDDARRERVRGDRSASARGPGDCAAGPSGTAAGCGCLARDDVARRVVGAAGEKVRGTRRRHLLHHHDLGNVGNQPVLLLAQGSELGERRDVRLMLPREEVRERVGIVASRRMVPVTSAAVRQTSNTCRSSIRPFLKPLSRNRAPMVSGCVSADRSPASRR